MKRTLGIILSAAVALLLCTSCNRVEKSVGAASEGFMKAYISMDYEAAAGFCTAPLAAMLTEGAEGMDEIPPVIMEKMKEASRETSFRIVSVTVNEEKTGAVVEMLLKAPGLEKEVPKTLSLLLEGRTALVDAVE